MRDLFYDILWIVSAFLVAQYILIPGAIYLLVLILWHWPWRERVQYPCPDCGYDIRATPHRCPECGKELRWGVSLEDDGSK